MCASIGCAVNDIINGIKYKFEAKDEHMILSALQIRHGLMKGREERRCPMVGPNMNYHSTDVVGALSR